MVNPVVRTASFGSVLAGRDRVRGVRAAFERFRVAFWALAAALIALYGIGLFLGIYSPLQLGLLSFVCLGTIVLFAVHEVRLRREIRRHPPHTFDHADRERRGW